MPRHVKLRHRLVERAQGDSTKQPRFHHRYMRDPWFHHGRSSQRAQEERKNSEAPFEVRRRATQPNRLSSSSPSSPSFEFVCRLAPAIGCPTTEVERRPFPPFFAHATFLVIDGMEMRSANLNYDDALSRRASLSAAGVRRVPSPRHQSRTPSLRSVRIDRVLRNVDRVIAATTATYGNAPKNSSKENFIIQIFTIQIPKKFRIFI